MSQKRKTDAFRKRFIAHIGNDQSNWPKGLSESQAQADLHVVVAVMSWLMWNQFGSASNPGKGVGDYPP